MSPDEAAPPSDDDASAESATGPEHERGHERDTGQGSAVSADAADDSVADPGHDADASKPAVADPAAGSKVMRELRELEKASAEAVKAESDADADGSEAASRPDPLDFQPAPTLRAPLRPAAVPPGFTPEAGKVMRKKKTKKRRFGRKKDKGTVVHGDEAVQEERVDRDKTPTSVYYTILFVSLVSFFVGFLYWNSTSIGPAWQLGFFIEMVLFGILVLVIATRLGRRQHWGRRFNAFIVGIFVGTFNGLRGMVLDATQGITAAGKGAVKSRAPSEEASQEEKPPNFITKGIQKVLGLVTGTIGLIIRIIVGVFKIIKWAWITIISMLWGIWWTIVFPVLSLAVRIVRWALRVTWRVARWALKVSWNIVYWFLRWWPIRIVTKMVNDQVRSYAEPKVLITNIIVSDVLLAPVKPETREKAEPFVAEYRHKQQVRRASKLLDKADERDAKRAEYQRVLSKDERRRMRDEERQRKAEAKQRQLEEKRAEQEADKQAKLEAKEAAKAKKAELSKLTPQQRKELQAKQKEGAKAAKEAEKQAKKEAKRAAKGKDAKTPSDADGNAETGSETGSDTKSDAKPDGELSRDERKALKQKQKEAKKAEKARLKAEKDAKKKDRTKPKRKGRSKKTDDSAADADSAST